MRKIRVPSSVVVSKSRSRVVMACLCCTLAFVPFQEVQAKRGGKPPQAQGDFIDHLDSYDTEYWLKADGWKNGSPFDNAWLAENITFDNGIMDIRLDDNATSGEPYASGNYQSTGFYGYGCYEASFKPVAVPGVVSSFFIFAGPFDNGGNGSHNEIDIEFLGYDTSQFQVNWWANDDSYTAGHEYIIGLGFDAANEFHRYGFKWTSTGINWFVDGEFVYQVSDSPSDPTPKATESLQKVMMNVWPVDDTAASWAGPFTYPGTPLHGLYDWVRHIAGEDCNLNDAPTPPPPPPPPPDGDASDVHVQNITMRLNSRSTQVIAEVLIQNGIGEPIEGVTVEGTWSGLITKGDMSRTTDTSGAAIFYSARSRDSGDVTFCVTHLTKNGMDYDPDADNETCDVITK